jgi:hypothetical protein
MPSKTWALLVHSEAIWMPFEAERALSRTKGTPEPGHALQTTDHNASDPTPTDEKRGSRQRALKRII